MGLFKNISAFGGIKMRVILFHIGDYPVRSYGIVVVLALLLSIGMARYLTRGTVYRQHIIDLAMYSVIGAIIGARFWHVFFSNGIIIDTIGNKSRRFGMADSPFKAV